MRGPPLALVAVSVLVLSRASPARADAASRCAATLEEGHAAERRNKLVDAGKQFLACAGLACPATIRSDCAKRLEAVSQATPSVTVVVRDASGTTRDVSLLIDGRAADARSGRAIPLDPGEHIASFGFDGKRWTQRFLAQEGERSRVIVLTPDTAELLKQDEREIAVSPPPVDAPAKPEVQRSIGPWILGGAGLATALVSVILFVDYKSTESRLRTQFNGACSADGNPTCSGSEVALQSTLASEYTASQQRAGTKAIPILAVVGLVAIAGAVVWRLLDTSNH